MELERLSGYIKLSAGITGITSAGTWSFLRSELHLRLADTQFSQAALRINLVAQIRLKELLFKGKIPFVCAHLRVEMC